jgi:hypothetical protein
MVFHDDADIADVVNATVHIIKEAAHQIGKADHRIGAGQIARIEEAIQLLQRSLRARKGGSKSKP